MGKHKYKHNQPLVPLTQQQRDEFMSFMDGYCSMAEDLPDGAWGETCKEGVVAFNKQYGTNYDPHEGWLLWCEHGQHAA